MSAREWRAVREGETHAASRNQPKTPESFIVGIGASGALLAGAAIVFVTLVGLVSFNVWPSSDGAGIGQSVELAAVPPAGSGTSGGGAPLSAAQGQVAATNPVPSTDGGAGNDGKRAPAGNAGRKPAPSPAPPPSQGEGSEPGAPGASGGPPGGKTGSGQDSNPGHSDHPKHGGNGHGHEHGGGNGHGSDQADHGHGHAHGSDHGNGNGNGRGKGRGRGHGKGSSSSPQAASGGSSGGSEPDHGKQDHPGKDSKH